MSNGDGGGFDFGGIFDPLLGVLAAVVQAIIDFLNALVGALVNALNFLYAGELGILGFSVDALGKIFTSLKNLLDQIFKVWVSAFLKHLLDLYNKLTAWVRKLKAWLDKLRRIQQQLMMTTLRRYLNMIQRIRRILLVFKLLHIGIAKKLDNFLARLEGRLTTSVFKFFQKQNEIIRWINLVADPRGLLSPGGVLATLGNIMRATNDAMAGRRPGDYNCVPGQETGPGVPVKPFLPVSQQLVTDDVTPAGDSARVTAQMAQMRALWDSDIGNVQNAATGA